MAGLQVPADGAYLGVVRHLAQLCARDAELSVDAADEVRLAVDELAWLLIAHADAGTTIDVELRRDDDDLYVRLSVCRSDAELPVVIPELSQRLLDATGGSHDLQNDGRHLFGVLQRPLIPPR
jgi:anti-sigma regulatory factor (Ser/Thr protein kinase)